MSRIHSANTVPGDRVAADAFLRGVPEKEDEEEDDEEKQGEDDDEGEKVKLKRTKEKAIQYEYRPTLWPPIALTDRVQGLGIVPSLWGGFGMATKRTKADKAQRQADQLEKKSERRPEQGTSKKKKYARTSAEPHDPATNPAQETWDSVT